MYTAKCKFSGPRFKFIRFIMCSRVRGSSCAFAALLCFAANLVFLPPALVPLVYEKNPCGSQGKQDTRRQSAAGYPRRFGEYIENESLQAVRVTFSVPRSATRFGRGGTRTVARGTATQIIRRPVMVGG